MANLFFNLPVTPGNGIGAPVNTSAMGGEKTITIQDAFRGTVNIEISEDGGVTWAQVATFTQTGKRVLDFASQFVRVRRTGVPAIDPGLPNIDISANDNGALFVTLPDDGTPVDTSVLGNKKTIIVQGVQTEGTVNIQVSDDNVNWATCMTFKASDVGFKDFTAKYMRSMGSPAVISVGAINDAGTADQDELVKVSAADTTPGYLSDKLVAGDNVSLVVLNPGNDEDIEISAVDDKVRVTANDTTPGLLAAKLADGSGIGFTLLNPGAGEAIEIEVVGADANNITTAAPITVRGDTNAPGAGAAIAKAAHQHRLELQVEDEALLAGARPTINFVGAGVGAADDPGSDRVNVTIPGNVTDGASVVRSKFAGLTAFTDSGIFGDAMSGQFVTVPIDGDYWAIFESESANTNANGVLEIGVSVNSLVAVVPNSERMSEGNANDNRWAGTTVYLGALIAGDLVRALYRKKSGSQFVFLYRRNLTIFKVQ